MSNRKQYAKLAFNLYSLFTTKLNKVESIKCDRLSNRRKVDIMSILCARNKQGNSKYFGNMLRYKANKTTNKIRVNIGLKGLSKDERKSLFLAKQNRNF